jgi:integration host factor subunit alpha
MLIKGKSNFERSYMTKQDLVDKVYAAFSHKTDRGYTKDYCYEIIEQALESLKEAIVSEDLVKVSGFGNFQVKHKIARRGRNPQTGEKLTISARKVLTFKPSLILKKSMNPE